MRLKPYLNPLALSVALAAGALFLSATALAQTDASKPEPLSKERTVLYLRATRAPLADLEKDVDHIGVLSETCRAQYGSKACGLPDKALDSDKLEDRYAYYVKGPVEAHEKPHAAKVDRRNWGVASAPTH
jgi:hypothetical protein